MMSPINLINQRWNNDTLLDERNEQIEDEQEQSEESVAFQDDLPELRSSLAREVWSEDNNIQNENTNESNINLTPTLTSTNYIDSTEVSNTSGK